MTIETYPEMNAEIVDLLRRDKDNPVMLYAARRIEELEAETERLRKTLSKSIKRRQIEVREAILARSETEDAILQMYSDCQDEIERLRKQPESEKTE